MTSWTIVALPREDDPVWHLSSEKVPHMTLLFLGEQSEPAMAVRITEYLQHAVETSLTPFGMSVERRGELGPDQADVLFFEEEYAKKLNDFRGFLLKNDDIAAAHASAFQYPQWTPHLTMGYPESPSKKLPPGQMGPGWVSFDRIAFWIEDYDGPEFILPRHSDMVAESSMAMSSEMDDFLAHHGVKGMKWGKRKAGTGEPSPRAVGKSERATIRETAKTERLAIREGAKKAYVAEIDTARASLTDKNNSAVEAKATWKQTKKAEGRRSEGAKAAKKIFKEKNADYWNTVETANRVRDGKEVMQSLYTDSHVMKYRFL